MEKILTALVTGIQKKPYHDPQTVKKFLERIRQGPPYLRDEGLEAHFCTFLAPVNLKERKIFIGHHKKGDSWMPPGGHIDLGENPIDTVGREWYEELGFVMTDEKIELFDISMITIKRPNQKCKIHYDFWHMVHSDLKLFKYDEREFYKAGWYDIEQACDMVTNPVYKIEFAKLREHFFKV